MLEVKMTKRKDYSGQVFGDLTVIAMVGATDKGNSIFKCLCFAPFLNLDKISVR
jgi:hypothetical protein